MHEENVYESTTRRAANQVTVTRFDSGEADGDTSVIITPTCS